jgi:putative transposase
VIGVQLRYGFRLYPNGPQRAAPARAFGCARVVFNDALRARETARAEGAPFPKAGELSKLLITEAKKTVERVWLGEVSAVVLQQSLRDLDTAYRNFFDGLKGKRPQTGAPRFKSKRDNRQAVRFTANARWRITPGGEEAQEGPEGPEPQGEGVEQPGQGPHQGRSCARAGGRCTA